MLQNLPVHGPLIPLGICLGLPVFAAMVGLVLMLRDQHARDTGRLYSCGVGLLVAALVSGMFMGGWNVVVGAAMLSNQQNIFATTVPLPEQ